MKVTRSRSVVLKNKGKLDNTKQDKPNILHALRTLKFINDTSIWKHHKSTTTLFHIIHSMGGL